MKFRLPRLFRNNASFDYFFEPLRPTFLDDLLEWAQRKSGSWLHSWQRARVKRRAARYERHRAKEVKSSARAALQMREHEFFNNPFASLPTVRGFYDAASVRLEAPATSKGACLIFTTVDGHEAHISLTVSAYGALRDIFLPREATAGESENGSTQIDGEEADTIEVMREWDGDPTTILA